MQDNQESPKKEKSRRSKKHSEKPKVIISESTKQKSGLCKSYMDQMKIERIYYIYTRQQRLKSLRDKISQQKISQKEADEMHKKHFERETTFLRLKRTRLFVKDFEIIAKIGKGGYGEVFLCKKKDTGEILALKRMSKEEISQMDQVKNIRSERDILAQHSSEWLVKLMYSFQDNHFLYLAMEYLIGGDLKALIQKVKKLDKNTACFYLAEMILCVEALHKLNVIHRDLKPENFLIDSTGHLKLTDFGLSKHMQIQEFRNTIKEMIRFKPNRPNTQTLSKLRSFSIVGTPDYMSPEILDSQGYGPQVDYWSLGCILYEMFVGFPPFSGEDSKQTLVNVLHYEEVLEFDEIQEEKKQIPADAWDLISKLFQKPEKRIGAKSIQEIKDHPFLSPIDWETSDNQLLLLFLMLEMNWISLILMFLISNKHTKLKISVILIEWLILLLITFILVLLGKDLI
ncbi:cell cycle protein kinase dbf2-related [Anaeramoeba ignava]|uniref:non-specific serine/threonine protein kinase n=1 Tax=Anaeramoeba ignava TaxID=1746090 RepID=A0A9Q0LJ61_ANAIG|nr:cell cycle protein kinase dbf2-related [Anaeramoeba ignava]